MNRIQLRVLDPVTYAINAIGAYWKRLLLVDMLFSMPSYLFLLMALRSGIQDHWDITGLPAFGLISVFPLIFFLSWIWSLAAYTLLSLDVYKNKFFDLHELVSSIRYVLSTLGARLLMFFFYISLCGGVAACGAAMSFFKIHNESFYIGLWTCLGVCAVVVSMWFYIKVSLATFFIVDKNYGAFKSLRASYQVTRGQFWTLVGVRIVSYICVVIVVTLLWIIMSIIVSLLGGVDIIAAQRLALFGGFLYFMVSRWMRWLSDGYVYGKLQEFQELSKKAENVTQEHDGIA